MVCTSVTDEKCPLAAIGKSKKPTCFSISPSPFPYRHQTNAWFDQDMFRWWINHVFWPWHRNTRGSVRAYLLVNNCSARKIDEKALPRELTLKYSPQNVMSTRQPADMRMIACLKVGYESHVLSVLLGLFDDDGGMRRRLRSVPDRRGAAKA